MCQKLLLVGYKGSMIIMRANSIQFGHFYVLRNHLGLVMYMYIYEMLASGL